MTWTRRAVLLEGTKLVAALSPIGLGAGCRGSDSCVDPDLLTTSQASLRASFHFTERSPHGADKECAGCRFFRAATAGDDDCGSCQILKGPVHPRGYCDSWAARA
jgi:hypothetical protein